MDLHEGHRDRMREQLKKFGMDSLTDVQVLEILLYNTIPRRDTNEIAHRLMERFDTLQAVFDASEEELLKVQGVTVHSAELIRMYQQLRRRLRIQKREAEKILSSTEKCAAYLLPYFENLKDEMVYMLCLDAKCKVLDCMKVHEGSVNAAEVSLRNIVRAALNSGATGVVLAHNHPSGIAIPSQEDRDTTLKLRDALDVVGVFLADHIIVADGDYVSLREDGLL